MDSGAGVSYFLQGKKFDLSKLSKSTRDWPKLATDTSVHLMKKHLNVLSLQVNDSDIMRDHPMPFNL